MESSIEIAIVNGDRAAVSVSTEAMALHNLSISFVRDGRELDCLLATRKMDLVILGDKPLGEDALSICRRLRFTSNFPIIMLAPSSDDASYRVKGLEAGADDVVAKPIHPRELVARIRAVLRRGSRLPGERNGDNALNDEVTGYEFAGWRIDVSRRVLFNPAGILVRLTSSEFDLMAILCRNAPQVRSRETLLEMLHPGRPAAVFDRSIDVTISRLRRKLEPSLNDPPIIETVRHGGYRLSSSVVAVKGNGHDAASPVAKSL